jgi:dipeptidyl aminopeptidase/acylaminoacyl peptidase
MQHALSVSALAAEQFDRQNARTDKGRDIPVPVLAFRRDNHMSRCHRALRRLLFLLILLAAVRSGLAEPPERQHQITIDDYFTIAVITGCRVSPDGAATAYTDQRWQPPDEKRNTDIWLARQGVRDPKRLTFDPADDSSPIFNPDGTHLFFASARKRGDDAEPPFNGKKQLWRIALDGGEPQAVTRHPEGIGHFDLTADARTLYYTVAEEHVDDEWKELRTEFKELTYGHGVMKASQLWTLDLVTWRSEKLLDNKRVINALAVSPDGRRVAMHTTPDEEIIFNEGWSQLDVFDSATQSVQTVTPGGWRNDHSSPYGWIDGVAWAADGEALALTVSFDGYPTRLYVVEWTEGRPALRELSRPPGVSVVGGTARWRGPSRDLCLIGEEKARARVYAVSDVRNGGQGRATTLTPGDVVVSAFDFSRDGNTMAVVLGTTQHFPDVFTVSGQGEYARVTHVNPQVETWKLPQISIVQWKGADGETVEGILELPPGYEPGGPPLPLVVEIHGGPTSATQYSLRYLIYGRTLLPAKGYALLSPNYRGSTGYGDKFLVDLIGRENDIEVEDILKGVDALIERGIADADRLAVMGWSNGGFLTNCLITRTDRFKAASSGAGVIDQVMQWGLEDTPGHVINYMKNLPWNDPDEFRASSPLYNLSGVKTPTLIHVGENDERVPAGHAKTLYRALRHYLNVPTELIVYPGEGHGLTKYKHRKAKMQWDLSWFERYIGSTSPPATEGKESAN